MDTITVHLISDVVYRINNRVNKFILYDTRFNKFKLSTIVNTLPYNIDAMIQDLPQHMRDTILQIGTQYYVDDTIAQYFAYRLKSYEYGYNMTLVMNAFHHYLDIVNHKESDDIAKTYDMVLYTTDSIHNHDRVALHFITRDNKTMNNVFKSIAASNGTIHMVKHNLRGNIRSRRHYIKRIIRNTLEPDEYDITLHTYEIDRDCIDDVMEAIERDFE